MIANGAPEQIQDFKIANGVPEHICLNYINYYYCYYWIDHFN